MAGAEQETKERTATLKAQIVSLDVPASSAVTEDASDLGFVLSGAGVLEPPYDPTKLMKMWTNSSCLGQNVQAYMTNIDGLGHRLAPRIDFSAEEAFEKVRDALWVEAVRSAGSEADPGLFLPSDEAVEARMESLRSKARYEKIALESFLDYANPDGSFESLRTSTRQDLEVTGNAYWEVLRNRRGEIARFTQVPSSYVRCSALDTTPTEVYEKVRVGLGWVKVPQHKFFRRYVQMVPSKLTKLVWFKAFGDPRVVSSETGEVYEDLADFEKNASSPTDQPASELIHFKIPAIGEAYGIPRWIGNSCSVLGSISADQVNYTYFENKAIPPLALLVSGGRLTKDSVEYLRNYIRDHIKGQDNFWSLLILEAEEASDALASHEAPKIKFEKLTDAQQGDALFQKYDERNLDKVGSSFRLPRLLRGDVRDFNKGTALVALRFSDEQVFEPERKAFDGWMNRVILPLLDITMWTFRSLGPQTRDPEKVSERIVNLVGAGVLLPGEARELASDVLGRDLEQLDFPWLRQPLQLTLAGFEPPEVGDAAKDEDQEDVEDKLSRMEAEAASLSDGPSTVDDNDPTSVDVGDRGDLGSSFSSMLNP